MAGKIIELKNVTYTYPLNSRPALKDISLELEAGKLYGIVGGNGSGKTTLCLAICGFATRFEKGTLQGEILIKGRNIDEYEDGETSRMMGYVLQNPHLFSGTVLENIRYGRLDATREEIEAAARAVSADTVVDKLEKGYESDVGEGGDRLSTGEKQLISFARAVLANPRIDVYKRQV